MIRVRVRPHRRFRARFGFGVVVTTTLVLLVGALATGPGSPVLADPVPGSQGTDTALAPTDSAVTFRGRDAFADLRISVNQTRQLGNQVVSVTWEGGRPTLPRDKLLENYLQVMQCWGDDDGTVPGNPGPPPEQCVFGATYGTYEGPPPDRYPSSNAVSRIIGATFLPNYDPSVGYVAPGRSTVWQPFRSVDGTVVNASFDEGFNPALGAGNFWLNPYFDNVTTNEIAGAPTSADGRGSELFQLNTGVESSGLGCGMRVQLQQDGTRTVPRCWLVVVPRGTIAEENVGAGSFDAVATSPLTPAAWRNRIAIPLEFNPVDSPCSIEQVERRITGTELALRAVASWQPVLCSVGGLPPFSYAPVSDSTARLQVSSPVPGGPGMVVVSAPVDPASVDPANPLVYAPVALSGVVIGFTVERSPAPTAPDEAVTLSGIRVADLNLTPRLVAKLLTQSYSSAVRVGNADPGYAWLDGNARDLGSDPDFLRFNPEFELLRQTPRRFASLTLPSGTSDAASLVWRWILADPEAAAFLDGEPDEWGMVVNPYYSTDPQLNPTGFAFDAIEPNSFPKSDPFCYQAPERFYNGLTVLPPALCGTDWIPYARGFNEAAAIGRLTFDGARVVDNPFAQFPADAWRREPPQTAGSRTWLSVTDSSSAAQFGLQTARLSRAGDNGPARTFIEPDADSIVAAVASAVPSAEGQVLEIDPTTSGPGAYPLPFLSYAVVAPLALDAEARADYASFVNYAADAGQNRGLEPGDLPAGYVEMPLPLRVQALAAGAVIADPSDLVPPPATSTTSTTPTTSTTTVPAPTTTLPPTSPPAPFIPVPTTSIGVPFNPPTPQTTAAESSVPPVSVDVTVPESTAPETDSTASPPLAPSTSLPPVEVAPGGPTSTPDVTVGPVRYAAPSMGAMGLVSLLSALEITKRPRRRASGTVGP